jgi:putative spermidine/putrescine transport system permease protein
MTRISSVLTRYPIFTTLLLLALPLAWLGVVYLGSLVALLVQGFFSIDAFTGQVQRVFTLGTYVQLAEPANLDIFARTAGMAIAVTLASAVLAFPLAYYMARYARGRQRALLYLAVVLPLWSSYIVRVYAWKTLLAREGILTWGLGHLGLNGLLDGVLALPGLGGSSLSTSPIGMFLVFVYVWLPYMILPIQAALERVPASLLDASADLGARPGTTFRTVTLPLALPGLIAGSIFTFSLTLGDFIIPQIIGDSSYFIGMAVLRQQGTAGNIPLAAAMTAVPMLIMGVYLLIARRMGAFEAL